MIISDGTAGATATGFLSRPTRPGAGPLQVLKTRGFFGDSRQPRPGPTNDDQPIAAFEAVQGPEAKKAPPSPIAEREGALTWLKSALIEGMHPKIQVRTRLTAGGSRIRTLGPP
jgi:hypothetical protein